jgi:hypothetical protein
MLAPARSPIESLESRRLFSDVTLNIVSPASPVTAAAELNDVPLTPAGGASAFLDGTVDVSDTRRGIKFLGGDVQVVDASGTPITYTFNTGVPGQDVTVSSVSLGFTSSRIPITGTKFNTRRVSASFDGGDVSAGGLPAGVNLNNIDAQIDYAVGRVKRSSTSLKITVPFNITATVTYTLGGLPQTLNFVVNGTMVGVGLYPSATPQAVAPQAVTRDDDDRVAADVLG